MKKRIMIAAYTVVGLLLCKFAFTYGYNEWVISKYLDGDYTENFNLLEVFNIEEPYIVYYNNGNVMYQNKDYEAAIEYYEKSLENDPPEGKECPIRINLALAKLALLGEDRLTPEKIDETIDTLNECLDILSEEDCANEDDDGHDNRAQRLYNEIKEMLEEAEAEKEKQEEEQQQNEQNNPDDQQNPDQNGDDQQNPDENGNEQQNPDENGDEDEQKKKEEEQRKKEEEERKQQREDEIEDEMEKRMDTSNEQRQEERRKSQAQDEDWNWYYDEIPVW